MFDTDRRSDVYHANINYGDVTLLAFVDPSITKLLFRTAKGQPIWLCSIAKAYVNSSGPVSMAQQYFKAYFQFSELAEDY